MTDDINITLENLETELNSVKLEFDNYRKKNLNIITKFKVIIMGRSIKKLQKKIQKIVKDKEVLDEHNNDALDIWNITQKLFEYLPLNEQLHFSKSNDFKKFRKKVEILSGNT